MGSRACGHGSRHPRDLTCRTSKRSDAAILGGSSKQSPTHDLARRLCGEPKLLGTLLCVLPLHLIDLGRAGIADRCDVALWRDGYEVLRSFPERVYPLKFRE